MKTSNHHQLTNVELNQLYQLIDLPESLRMLNPMASGMAKTAGIHPVAELVESATATWREFFPSELVDTHPHGIGDLTEHVLASAFDDFQYATKAGEHYAQYALFGLGALLYLRHCSRQIEREQIIAIVGICGLVANQDNPNVAKRSHRFATKLAVAKRHSNSKELKKEAIRLYASEDLALARGKSDAEAIRRIAPKLREYALDNGLNPLSQESCEQTITRWIRAWKKAGRPEQ